jgi:hypothetical protein
MHLELNDSHPYILQQRRHVPLLQQNDRHIFAARPQSFRQTNYKEFRSGSRGRR